MAKITTAKRKALPKKEYALPGKAKKGVRGGAPRGAYPVDTKARAQNAKARSQQQYEKGNLSKGERDTIWRKANAVLKAKGAKTITTLKGMAKRIRGK